LLGGLRKLARDDDQTLLETLKAAALKQPADPVAWIRAAIANRTKPQAPGRQPDPNDPWGIQRWCAERGFAPTVSENDRKGGKWIAKPGGREVIIDRTAIEIAKAARLPGSWAGSWDVILDWIASGRQLSAMVTAIKRSADQDSYDPASIRSLRYFDCVLGYRREAA
jgi:hypothetical protein